VSARILTRDEVVMLRDEAPCCVVTDGDEAYIVAREDSGTDLCTVFRNGDDPDEDEQIAILLAAAPDLRATALDAMDRADAAEATAHRVTMERDGARHLADEAQRARAKQSLELAEARAEVVRLRADLERAGEMIARSIENRAAPLAWGSVEWKRETPDVLTLRLSDGTGERVARIPVEKGALVGAAAKMAKSEMRAEARDAKAGAR